MKSCAIALVVAGALSLASPGGARISGQVRGAASDWPEVSHQTRPWTRWWWLGSALDAATITRELEAFGTAGLGGVELTPIYGVRGDEPQFVPYLSDAWLQLLEHTLREARRLGLGVDMATGTGWPFGGPWVSDTDAARGHLYKIWEVSAGEQLKEPVRLRQVPLVRAIGNPALQIGDLVEPVSVNHNLQALALEQVRYPKELPLVSLMAYGRSGEVLDLTRRVGVDHRLDWTAPPGLMANRIASLDRSRVPWRRFYNVNFPSRLPENRGPDGLFTAASWEPLASGLLGPVVLTPLHK